MEKSLLVNDSLAGSCIALAQSLVLLLAPKCCSGEHLRPDFHSFSRAIVMTGWWVAALGPKYIPPELVLMMLLAGLKNFCAVEPLNCLKTTFTCYFLLVCRNCCWVFA